MNRVIFTLILLVGFACPTFAITASELSQGCKAEPEGDKSPDYALAIGYTMGYLDAMDGYGVMNDDGTMSRVVIEKGVNAIQACHVFVQYLASHPAMENKTAGEVLPFALGDAHLATLVKVKKVKKGVNWGGISDAWESGLEAGRRAANQ